MRLFLLTCLLTSFLGPCLAQQSELSLQELEHVIPSDLPPTALFDGLFKDGLAFEDQGGRNFLIYSELWNRAHTRKSIYFRQYAELKGTLRETWAFALEAGRNCPAHLLENSLRVIDLDQDGNMEVSFILQKDCEDSTGLHEFHLFSQGKDYLARAFADPLPDVARAQFDFGQNLRNGPGVFRWFLEEEWKNLTEEGAINGVWSWELASPEFRLLRWESHGKSPKTRFTWLGKDGQPAYLPPELRILVMNARAFRLLPETGEVLLLHTDAIGAVNPGTKVFTPWREFEAGELLLSDWSWSPSGERFAFAVLNKRKYLDKTAIVTMDVEKGQLVDSYDHQVPVAFEITDIARGFPLIFHDERHVEFSAHPQGTEQGTREQWLLDTLPEEN